jgi:hypothetical protein
VFETAVSALLQTFFPQYYPLQPTKKHAMLEAILRRVASADEKSTLQTRHDLKRFNDLRTLLGMDVTNRDHSVRLIARSALSTILPYEAGLMGYKQQ